MEIFVYEPIDLERPAFRLLQLLRGKGPAIECMLYQAYLDGTDTIPYDALSYTWGGTDKTSTVTVNGKYLDVTENLHSALQHLRSEDTDRVLWVDAICIDQGNERERGHQVQQMCKIYSQAEEVIVWLGQATEETNILMDSLQRLEEHSSMQGHRHWDLAQWTTFWLLVRQDADVEPRKGLDMLLGKPWFRRVWILQEIANAKKASVWCGAKSVRARTFALAPSLIGVKPERHCQAVLDIMPGRLREETWWYESRDLYNLLLKFSESEASDPRDKVYALLGISSDACDTDSLRPDYVKDLQEVIRDTSLFLFGPSDVSYETMPELLENLTSRNATSFLEVVETSDTRGVEHFLVRRGLEVPLSEDMIKGAVGNQKSGRDIMRLFLQQRRSEVGITEAVVRAAAENVRSGRDIIILLLEQCDSEAQVTKGVVNALYEASSGGHEAVVKLLLDKGAEVNAQCGYFGNALQAASLEGHEAVVKLLLDAGAEVNAQSEHYENALYEASSGGHEAVVKLLLDKGAEVNAQSGPYGNALYAASERGHKAVVKLLLDKGAEVNAQCGYFGNALQAASLEGHEAVVKLLLDAGAEVNAQGGHYGNALQAASEGGHEQVVKTLLNAGAEVNAQGGDYGNALYAASEEGHEQVVKTLLNAGAEVNVQGGLYGNALQAVFDKNSLTNQPDKVGDSDVTSKTLRKAVEDSDSSAVRELLEHDLDRVAHHEYEWLHELVDVGYSRSNIADLLLEEAMDAPWIYFNPQDRLPLDLDTYSPTLTLEGPPDIAPLESPWASKRRNVQMMIQQLCGLGGIAPISRSLEDWNGEVNFKNNYSVSQVSYAISSEESGYNDSSMLLPRLRRVLKNFCEAAKVLQRARLCSNQFTIARAHIASTSSSPGTVKLETVDIDLAVALLTEFDRISTNAFPDTFNLLTSFDIVTNILRPLMPSTMKISAKSLGVQAYFHLCCLAVQFLCFGLVSFCQGHVGPVELFFINRSQERSELLGNRILKEDGLHLDPHITVHLSKLTCFGKMTGGPLITFSMSDGWLEGDARTRTIDQEDAGDGIPTRPMSSNLIDLSPGEGEYHLEATPNDIVYTWGPGQLIPFEGDEPLLQAIRVGGGVIYPKNEVVNEFHWESEPGPRALPRRSFHRQSSLTVGASVMENPTQCTFPWQHWRLTCRLSYLGVEAEQWHPNQRQLGLQVGPDHAALQAIQVWTKIPARLLKQYQLQQERNELMNFLGCYMGVQVSCCTGVARRVSLRRMLIDLLPKYRLMYLAQADWDAQNNQYGIIRGLERTDAGGWLSALRCQSAETYEHLLRDFYRILKILEPTGLSRDRTYVQIAWPKDGEFHRGVKLPCRDKRLWAQILTDSEEGVTFAYMMDTYLLCDGTQCQQQSLTWRVTTKCLGTAVTRYRNELEQEPELGIWDLQDGRSYHMWNDKSYIRLKANVVGTETRLIASRSVVPGFLALRHFRGKRYKGECLIREHHHPDDSAIDVLILD